MSLLNQLFIQILSIYPDYPQPPAILALPFSSPLRSDLTLYCRRTGQLSFHIRLGKQTLLSFLSPRLPGVDPV